MLWDLRIQDIDVLHANGISGTHYCGNVMGIKYIFQYQSKIGLAFG
jgi:hypothetical protein